MTTAIFGIITAAIYTTLIVGLIKPALILRWSNNPTRTKIIGLWFASFFVVPMLAAIIISDDELTEGKIERARENLNQGNYRQVISSLSEIKENDPLYTEAQVLINQADSLNELLKINEQLEERKKVQKAVEEEKKELKEQLEREINAVKSGIDFSAYRGSVDALQMELVLFASYGSIITRGEYSNDPIIKELAAQLKPEVVKMQSVEFPILRKEYAKVVGKLMWEHDIEVEASGPRNTYLNFTGGVFAANRNKQDFQEQLKDVPAMFRFNQTRYRWYRDASEYTYYTTFEGKDSDIVSFK